MMKQFITLWLMTVLFIISSINLHAADLVNNDNVSYTIFVDVDDKSSVIMIAPKETISDICKDCYIEIDGNPDGVSIDNEAKIIIKEGKLFIDDQV